MRSGPAISWAKSSGIDGRRFGSTTVAARFTGKTVLITGAASGLGAETARQFGAEGAALMLIDRDVVGLSGMASHLREAGVSVGTFEGDASACATATGAVASAVEAFGGIDVLFNNAGIDPLSATTVMQTTEAEWDAVMAVNVKAAFLFCRAALPGMIERGSGAIVSTASIAALKPGAAETAYNVSKAALVQLMRSIALDYAGYGIRANALCPGFLEAVMSDRRRDLSSQKLADRSKLAGGLVPLGREGKYAEMARSVLFLADQAESAHITGATLVADGGLLLA